jgi:hypothetical protein
MMICSIFAQVRSHVHDQQEIAADLTALLGCLKQQTELANKRKQQGQVGALHWNLYE